LLNNQKQNKMNAQQLIAKLNPETIYVLSSNYVQCEINGQFCEFQIDYTQNKKWYQFQSKGKAKSPTEKFIKWIN
jgi:hypothetical protein